jgi:hypothetical protein
MTEIMVYYRKLKEYLKIHVTLYERLRKTMRSMEAESKGSRVSSEDLPQGTAEVPDYDERMEDWGVQWQASDNLRDVMDDDDELAPLGSADDFDENEYDYDESMSTRLVG